MQLHIYVYGICNAGTLTMGCCVDRQILFVWKVESATPNSQRRAEYIENSCSIGLLQPSAPFFCVCAVVRLCRLCVRRDIHRTYICTCAVLYAIVFVCVFVCMLCLWVVTKTRSQCIHAKRQRAHRSKQKRTPPLQPNCKHTRKDTNSKHAHMLYRVHCSNEDVSIKLNHNIEHSFVARYHSAYISPLNHNNRDTIDETHSNCITHCSPYSQQLQINR